MRTSGAVMAKDTQRAGRMILYALCEHLMLGK